MQEIDDVLKKKSPNLQYFVIEPALRLMLKFTGFSNVVDAAQKKEKGIEDHVWLESPQNGTIVTKRGSQTRG